MARLLLSLFGYRLDFELCRDLDPETTDDPEEEAADVRGSCITYPIGFTQPEAAPYDVDFPDRGAWSD